MMGFLRDGYLNLGPIIESVPLEALYTEVLRTREWGEALFRSKAECDAQLYPEPTEANPRNGVNPGKGVCNLAETFDLRFIEDNASLRACTEAILGPGYDTLLKKFIVGVPDNWLPAWIRQRMKKEYFDNLNAYVKAPYRDVTYFRGIDYHMDIMDQLGERPDIVTVYVYLTDVTRSMSPLHVIKGSHIYAHTIFPHFHQHETDTTIEVGEDAAHVTRLQKDILVGEAGATYLWSSLTMHGTQPLTSDDLPRISLRYTLKKHPQSDRFVIDDFLDQHDLATFVNRGNNSRVIARKTLARLRDPR